MNANNILHLVKRTFASGVESIENGLQAYNCFVNYTLIKS